MGDRTVIGVNSPPATYAAGPELENRRQMPTGPEHQFLVGEGRYALRETVMLAASPPEPLPAISLNPLSSEPRPITGRCRFSMIATGGRSSPPISSPGSRGPSAPSADTISLAIGSMAAPQDVNVDPSAASERDTNGRASTDLRPSLNSSASEVDHALVQAFSSAADEMARTGNSLLTVPLSTTMPASSRDQSPKRRKPKSSVTNSGSAFIARTATHENLSRRLASRSPDGMFAFANVGRSCQWLDLAFPSKGDYLIKILFSKSQCLCHDINKVSATSSHVDIVMGFSTSDIIWFEPFSQKYSRINKNGIINPTAVLDIKWMPGSDNLFMAAHQDGSVIIYDKEQDDAVFDPAMEEGEGRNNTNDDGQDYNVQMHVIKSTASRNQKTNPVAIWKVSKQAINAIAFATDDRHVALACQNNSWRMIDYVNEELLHIFHTYFGPVNCLAWSPDYKYVITGGVDDLVLVWSISNATVVARCQGHHAWVRYLAFDPWRCDDRTYRFGSVGHDCKLCLWDFGPGTLNRQVVVASQHQKNGVSNGTASRGAQMHWLDPRAKVPTPPPVLNKQIGDEPLEWISFTEDAIYTGAGCGRLHVWDRPETTAAAD